VKSHLLWFDLPIGRSVNGRSYDRVRSELERLNETVFRTDIKTGGSRVESGFSLISNWSILKEDETGRMLFIEVRLCDWIYNSTLSMNVLTISEDYFKTRKPTEKRMYELARKHCGNQHQWRINISTLKIKVGTTTPLKSFRAGLKKIQETDCLPEYKINMTNDIVTFILKAPRIPVL